VASKPSSSPATRYHHGDLRNALIAEGRRALEEIGVRELSLRYLARAVGVSEAAPSRHFAGKEALLASIAANGFSELVDLREKIAATNDPPMATAYRMMRSYVEFAKRNKGLFDLMVGPRLVAGDSYPELVEQAGKSFNLFASAIARIAIDNEWPGRSFSLVSHAAWAMEHGLATLILSDRVPRSDVHVRPDQMIEFSISLLLSALVNGPEHLQMVVGQIPASRKKLAAA